MASLVSFMDWNEETLIGYLKSKDINHESLEKLKGKCSTGKNFVIFCDSQEKLQKIGISRQDDVEKIVKTIQELRRNYVLVTSKIFQDPIHGTIELHPLLVSIIDTPQFQRLRDIKQLGGVYYVYPGASHNRFEHSIGVCYIAGEFIESLQYRQPQLGINNCDVLCIKIAALCHDIGHGPFSHLFQDLFIPEVCKTKWKHEECSFKLLEHLVKQNNLEETFKLYGLEWETNKTVIKRLMMGVQVGQTYDEKKYFLYEIVANHDYHVDVDKMDYLARDCHGLGIEMKFCWKRYIKFARVIEANDGKYHICLREKIFREVYELFHIRDTLFRNAYQHKTKRAVEIMICDALVKANDKIFIRGEKGKQKKMSEAIDDMYAFTNLTDSVIGRIRSTPSEDLEESQKLLERAEKRKLYKFIGHTKSKRDAKTKPHEATAHQSLDDIRKHVNDEYLSTTQSSSNNFYIDVVEFQYGNGEENPVDKMWFYKKYSPDKATRIKSDQESSMLPKVFIEVELRMYCTSESPEVIKTVER